MSRLRNLFCRTFHRQMRPFKGYFPCECGRQVPINPEFLSGKRMLLPAAKNPVLFAENELEQWWERQI